MENITTTFDVFTSAKHLGEVMITAAAAFSERHPSAVIHSIEYLGTYERKLRGQWVSIEVVYDQTGRVQTAAETR